MISQKGLLSIDQPLVSIIMPCYNHAQYVREALLSVVEQTYPNIELIIIDDGSKDGTPRLVVEVLAEIRRDMRVVFKEQKNAGLCTTLNRALELAKGDFVQFIASDDAYLPEKTERSVEALIQSPADVAAVYCDGYIFDEKSRRCGVFSDKYRVPLGGNLYRELLIANWMPAMGLIYRRDVLKALGGFDPKLKFEDWDLLLRLTKTSRIERIPDRLFLYRIHSENMTRDSELMQETTAEIAKKHRDMAAFWKFKADVKRRQIRGLFRNAANVDLVLRSLSRKIFTNRGIQGVGLVGATLELIQIAFDHASARRRAFFSRLYRVPLGRNCKIGGNIRVHGNRRNLNIGDNVTFEGDVDIFLPQAVGQGQIVIGDGCVLAHGSLFHCIAGDLVLGASSYVGRNAVLKSLGDMKIGAQTLISANAGLYACNDLTLGTDDPLESRGGTFLGITLGVNCRIGHGAVVMDGTKLGPRTILAPNAVAYGTHPANARVFDEGYKLD